jgi:hypothetical protein
LTGSVTAGNILTASGSGGCADGGVNVAAIVLAAGNNTLSGANSVTGSIGPSGSGTVQANQINANGSTSRNFTTINGKATLTDFPSVKDYGAVADRVDLADAGMTASSALLSTAHTFTQADVGKVIIVGGAGAVGYPNNLITTIASVNGGSGTGAATLASVAANTVSGAVANFGTENVTAFASAVAAANGSGLYIPGGNYLLSNVASSAIFLGFPSSWSGTVQFGTGANLMCESISAFPCFNIQSSSNITVVNPTISFAGTVGGPKTSGYNSVGFQVGSATNVVVNNPTISNGGSACFSEVNNINLQVSNLTINRCNSNGFYSSNSQDTILVGENAQGCGDYCLEIDNKSGAGTTNTGFTATGIHANKSFGGLLIDSKQKASISDIEITNTCDGGIKVLSSFENPLGINIGKFHVDGAGQYWISDWNVAGGCASTGHGAGIGMTGATSAHPTSGDLVLAGGYVNNTNGSVFGVNNWYSATVADVSFDTGIGPIILTGNTNLFLNTLSMRTMNYGIVSDNNTNIQGSLLTLKNMCTSTTNCASGGYALDLGKVTGNNKFNLYGITVDDSQGTPTGYKVRTQNTVSTSTINNIQGLITSGTLSTTLDANTVLDALSLGQAAPSSSTPTLDQILSPVASHSVSLTSFPWTLGATLFNTSGQLVNTTTSGGCTTPAYSWSGATNSGIGFSSGLTRFCSSGNNGFSVAATGALFANTNGLVDQNGNMALAIFAVSSAVNHFEVLDQATGAAPELAAVGSDTNININLTPKGNGNAYITTGMILNYSNASQPTCSATAGPGSTSTEGLQWYTKGSGVANGVYQICQNQSGTYTWVTH